MKRFGGMDFLSDVNLTTINVLNETIVNRITTALNRITQSNSTVDAANIVSLFQVYPPQASVFNYLFLFFSKK